MVSPEGAELPQAVARLRDAAAAARLPLELPGVDEARRARRELVAQLDDYVLPRLRHPQAPLLAAVGGSTGAGRSTLVNSLVGREVSPAGVLRPTTRVPVLVCRAHDRPWFSGTRVLPGLRRVAPGPRAADAGPALVLQVDDRVPAGLAVLDVPDIDSIDDANRELAVRLLGAADVWLFVTTAARYADAVPWHLLRVARERTAELAVVLARVPETDLDEVRADFQALLAGAGLGAVPVFTLPETTLNRGLLSRAQVAPVRNWLYGRATDPDARATAARRTLGGALDSLPARSAVVGRAAEGQHEAASKLAACVRRSYAAASRHLDAALGNGELLAGETLARCRAWADAGRPEAGAVDVAHAVAGAAEDLVRDIAERAAGLTESCWRARLGGAELILATRAGVVARGADGTVRDPGVPVEDLAAEAAAGWLEQCRAAASEDASGVASLLVAAVTADAFETGAPSDVWAGTSAGAPAGAGSGRDDGDALASPDGAVPVADTPRDALADLRLRAATVLDAGRDRRLRAVAALRTGPGEGLGEAVDAIRRAG
ncbi:ATP-binding protein [Yinghuangia seranimata]|uniref:ATP-binding protein n=1 Tax=Yinghuangia seranimata TaxID=408067 RepID=UPI00248C4229|nr:ATP-binding protein [Yinghuangia seranimata]MDI2127333.1 ATP-binding protein [Yinghuangia seranimata]